MSVVSSLNALLSTAWQARSALLAALHADATTAYRLFHGSVEGWPGLTIDRYGDILLIQTFHQLLSADELVEIQAFYQSQMPELHAVYNDRSASNSRIGNALPEADKEMAHQPRMFQELGINYLFQCRHAGQDPWLFLDLRAARRRLLQEFSAKPGQSLLNVFSYTCGVGLAAAKGGAAHVVNVDFAETALKVGKDNAKLNELFTRPRQIKSDAFAAMRQFAGIGQPERVRGKPMPPFPKLEKHAFDWVFLDPPRYAKSPFGVVDLVNDYAALFKPALLCTAEGGTLVCCNNVAEVAREAWLDQLERSARKAGRPVREAEWIMPEADFPSRDDSPPLKTLLLRV